MTNNVTLYSEKLKQAATPRTGRKQQITPLKKKKKSGFEEPGMLRALFHAELFTPVNFFPLSQQDTFRNRENGTVGKCQTKKEDLAKFCL